MGKKGQEQAEGYDEAARATDWQGPSLVFDLLSRYIQQGQTVLDIGIGTGLGSEPLFRAGLRVTGMDSSDGMLDACRKKGFAERLVRHDLTVVPYPFGDGSIDIVISTGVFQFFPNLEIVFDDVARILPEGGRFAFVTIDRTPEEPAEIIASPEQTGTDETIMMYCHTPMQVTGWLEKSGFVLVDSVEFTIWMDEKRSKNFFARAYLAQKKGTGHYKEQRENPHTK
ncbi:MAG: class I SAM-dependent methyltransferase [Methanoregula sp.]|nr:MAG: class I SAM-dependent methyltransferase [Methanoregula sp.]